MHTLTLCLTIIAWGSIAALAEFTDILPTSFSSQAVDVVLAAIFLYVFDGAIKFMLAKERAGSGMSREELEEELHQLREENAFMKKYLSAPRLKNKEKSRKARQ